MKRSSGVLMHITSLWGEYSCGSFGTPAKEWIDFLAESKFTYWQILPFCIPDEYNSPYKSFSAFSGNPFFIDLPTLEEQGLITKEELKAAEQKSPHLCEFDRLNEERLALLKAAATRFTDVDAMNAFFKTHKHTEAFCKFMALREANGGKPWTEWTKKKADTKALFAWKFIQYTVFTQWKSIKDYANAKCVKIIGDIPIYVDIDSSDVWASPELYQLGEDLKPKKVAGVPPDYFSADGQKWGNPLYDWDKMAEDGFSWWRDRMAFMCELFDGVRIDHFRGLESYFSIPAEEPTARNGVWVKGPGMALVRALKEVCGDKLIIAEDLGDITPEVKELVKESGFPGMRVMQFGFLGDKDSPHLPHNYDNNCVAYTGTHDNNTLLGYVWDLSVKERERFLRYVGYESPMWDRCYDFILRTMMASHAGLVIFPVQDLLKYGMDTRINTPGVSNGNWAFRITKEQFSTLNKNLYCDWNEIYSRD